MTHDPLCPTVTEPHGVGYDCECDCLCDLIAEVREDTLANQTCDDHKSNISISCAHYWRGCDDEQWAAIDRVKAKPRISDNYAIEDAVRYYCIAAIREKQ